MSSQQQPVWNNAGQGGSAGGYQLQPVVMPGQVRAAQVLFFVMGGLGLLAIVLTIVGGNARAAGSISATALPSIMGLVSALRFPKRKPNTRGTAIFIASLMIVVGLGTLGQGQPAGLVLCGVGATIVILLSQRGAGHWFQRRARS